MISTKTLTDYYQIGPARNVRKTYDRLHRQNYIAAYVLAEEFSIDRLRIKANHQRRWKGGRKTA